MFEKWKAITPNQTIIKHPSLFLNELFSTNLLMNLMLPGRRDEYSFQERQCQWAGFFFLEINHVNLEVQQLRCRIADSHPPSRECVLSHLGLDKHPWRLVFTPGRFGWSLLPHHDTARILGWPESPFHMMLQKAQTSSLVNPLWLWCAWPLQPGIMCIQFPWGQFSNKWWQKMDAFLDFPSLPMWTWGGWVIYLLPWVQHSMGLNDE